MANLNRAILIGRVLDDPEVRTTFSGSLMLRIRLRIDRPAELAAREASDILDVVAWDRIVEQTKSFLFRDAVILVEGRLQIRSFDGADGKRKYATEIVARSIRPISSGGAAHPKEPAAVPAAEEEVDFADFEAEGSLSKSLPF